MKITCSKTDLLNGLNIALRAVPARSSLPILECFLIEANENIKITTNDNDLGIETIIDGTVNQIGKIAINARILSDIVRKLPENNVLIEANSNFKVRIKCEDAEFTLNGNNYIEFPELPQTKEENKITISQFTLKELIKQTIFSISLNDANAIMRGELFSIDKDNIKITSLDSHRISIRKEKLPFAYDNFKSIIPGKTLIEISRILTGENGEMVDISFDKKFVKFSFDKTKVISRLIEGEYFNVEQMISSDYDCVVKLNKNEFINVIERAVTLTREGEKKPIVLEVRDGLMNVEISSSLGSMNDHVYVNKEGKDVTIGFNPRFFLDVMKVIDDEEISIYFVNANAPCVIKDKDENYLYILLPVNINR